MRRAWMEDPNRLRRFPRFSRLLTVQLVCLLHADDREGQPERFAWIVGAISALSQLTALDLSST